MFSDCRKMQFIQLLLGDCAQFSEFFDVSVKVISVGNKFHLLTYSDERQK